MKKYILFDNDGVLVETENWYYEANKKALKQLGLNLQRDEYQEIMARGGTAWELAINAGITTEIIDKKRVQRDNYYQEFLHTKNLEIPNVKKVLKNLSKKYKMAIVTTSRRVEDYKRAKSYLEMLELFKALPEHTIVVEDS